MAKTSAERLVGIRAKIERAKEHIRNLDQCVQAFRDSHSYDLVIDKDSQASEQDFRIRIPPPPIAISLVAGDAIHNLRSALDHLAWQLIEASGGVLSKATRFPVYDTAAKYRDATIDKAGNAKGPVKGIKPKAINLIEAAQPYQTGYDGIGKLHQLDIIDKHKLLLITAYKKAVATLTIGGRSEEDATMQWITPVDANAPGILKNGTSIGGVRGIEFLPDVHKNLKLSFEIAFGETGIVQGEPVVPFLTELAHLVDKVVNKFMAGNFLD